MENINENQLAYYFNQLGEEDQYKILEIVQQMVEVKAGSTERITVDQYNLEIDEAVAEADRGETLSHEEVVALSKNW